MGVMIIKKEDIKEDIEILFEDNIVYDGNLKEPYIYFNDGKLKVAISNKTIVDNDILNNIELKKEYLDRFSYKEE